MSAFYNENDPQAAAWLRELIARDLIAPGVVDERSIEDICPNELAGYAQCHFFAGIGGWSYALRLAGWPDDRPVWTGSCPCQPFSAAGKGAGFADERHLWPAFQHLISQCRPPAVFGEQVASSNADAWIDLVHADMENLGYAFGCVPFPAAGVGAPHIRDRNYWLGVGLADANGKGLSERVGNGRLQRETLGALQGQAVVSGGDTSRLAHADSQRHDRQHALLLGQEPGRFAAHSLEAPRRGEVAWMAHPEHAGPSRAGLGTQPQGTLIQLGNVRGEESATRPDATNGFWRAADWLGCRDGKWRPVEPGTFPLAHGLPARVVRLRGYGNAIVPQQAAAFVRAYLESQAVAREAA